MTLARENSLPRYDNHAHDQILKGVSLSDNDDSVCVYISHDEPRIVPDG